ncbi:30S ribosomal protein S16 [Haloactinomyces albus]|uniref:Small ribosomal subunit protein bS16 n=1 Tax=Haloactinomyces albus TaxID=1352928 RepID=A0AAE3Z9C4_9ACTN|nr:30S ribosomal protein S16 [Haloactinomyces albus]MDR7300722.1 small subunit ribosomal protein S16 [Haloactinomyces albus]
MAVKIKLARIGKIREPHYRVVIADSRTRRNGRVIEEIGQYHPKQNPSHIEVDSERVQYWLGVGAQPTEPVQGILEVTGDWQKFKGLPGAEGNKNVAAPKPTKQELFEAALAAAGEEPSVAATTPKKKGGGKKTESAQSEGEATASESAGAEEAEPKSEEGQA